jgi:AcrR family transcriptional regulator
VNRDSKKRTAVQPPLRSRIREATSEAIIAAAEEVFSEQGLHAAHVGAIAARAGVSVGTLYNHFEDREALVAALLAARKQELLGRLDEALAEGAREPFRAQLARFVRALLDHFDSHRRFFSILIESEHARERETFPAAAAPRTPRNSMLEVYRRIDELLRRGVRQRALRAAGAELYPSLLMGVIRGVLVRDLYEKTRGPLASHAEAIVAFFLDGAGAR